MTAALWTSAALLGLLLIPVAFVQVLYLESLRLRGRERAALEFFRTTLAGRLGLEADQGLLTFAVLKHTLLILIGLVFLWAGWASGGRGARVVGEAFLWAWLTMLASTYVVPHVLYRRSRGRWLQALLPLLRVVALLVRPLVWVFDFVTSLAELADLEKREESGVTPAESVDALLSAGAEEGLIEETDRELIQSVMAFGDKTVREVMTPRPNIVAVEAETSLEELRRLVIDEQYSRLPVFQGSVDQVIGFVHVRDMFELEEDERKRLAARDLLRELRYVPESKPVTELVKEMQQDRAHMAVVIDEYGHTAGLVTLEDLVEEVFGEIRDEHEPGLDVTPDGDGYIVSGNFGLDRLQELLDVRLPEDTESTTVGGLILEWLGRVPDSGETVERDGLRLEVQASDELRVQQVRVSRREDAARAG
ncbi:MAG: HlyC/CorC family transporter [Acidobacteria bacterium]|nr:HlyC/CorC family transporter [Acidobacteriota bacterium]